MRDEDYKLWVHDPWDTVFFGKAVLSKVLSRAVPREMVVLHEQNLRGKQLQRQHWDSTMVLSDHCHSSLSGVGVCEEHQCVGI